MPLPPALINAADRLAAILMVLVRAISPVVLTGSTPTFPGDAAQTLLFRLTHLVTTLIRISKFGIPTRPEPDPDAPPAGPDPTDPRPNSGSAQRLPSRPGWLLAALPDLAPAIAADLTALLADPALAALLAADPSLHRALRPILRGLGLEIPGLPSEPPPQPDPTKPVGWGALSHPTTPPQSPVSPDPPPPPPIQTPTSIPQSLHAHFVTLSKRNGRAETGWLNPHPKTTPL